MSGSYKYSELDTSEIQRVERDVMSEGKGSLMIFDRFAKLKYKYGTWYWGAEDTMWIQ